MNLLSELCGQIDVLAWGSSCSPHEISTCKSNIKKLLIKYEAKENPNMKINEVAAEIEALKHNLRDYVDQSANSLIHRMDCENRRLLEIITTMKEVIGSLSSEINELKNKVEDIDEMQDNESERLDKIEETVNDLSHEFDELKDEINTISDEEMKKYWHEKHCKSVLSKNTLISDRVNSVKYLSLVDSLKKLNEFIAHNRVTDIMVFEKIQNILKGVGEL